jgi:hypothetical protein
MPTDPPKYKEPFPEETTVIHRHTNPGYSVESTASGFGGASSASTAGGASGSAGAPGPGLAPPAPSGQPPVINPDGSTTENYDEPLDDGQGNVIGVRHNSRTVNLVTKEIVWSVIDEIYGRIATESYGSTFPDKSGSYTDRFTYASGATRLTTRTVEADELHGREVTTDTDANGQTTSETITEW